MASAINTRLGIVHDSVKTSFTWITIVNAIVFIAVLLLCSSCSAEVLVFGSNYNYSEVVLPNNSYVHQGENISQGFFYDLSGVYGFTGTLGHWNYEDDEGYGYPDYIYDLGTRPFKVYIDPEKFPAGRWYQWDGIRCNNNTGFCRNGFGRGNNYVFAVVKNITPPSEPSITTTIVEERVTIIVFDGNTSTTIEAVSAQNKYPDGSYAVVSTPSEGMVSETIVLQTTRAEDAVTEVPTEIVAYADIPEVTPRSPVSVPIIIGALLIAGVFACRS